MASILIPALAAATAEQESPAPKKANHQAKIVQIKELRQHTNADTLELLDIDGYQVVVKKGDFRPGDLAVYVQPDSVVPQTEPFRFIWGPYIPPPPVDGNQWLVWDGNVTEKRRRITVRKFRGEWSEGLLMPLTEFVNDITQHSVKHPGSLLVGMDVSDIIGITHYDPDTEVATQTHAPRRKHPKTLKGWFFFILHKLTGRGRKSLAQEVSFHLPTYDVEAYKNHTRVFKEGDNVSVTEKIHGSNARFVYIDGVMYAGSRSQWKAPDAGTVWNKALKQNPWIETWCKDHPGVALYGEVTPTQKAFNYGCGDGEVRFFLFDIYDKGWVPQSGWDGYIIPANAEKVPLLYTGPFQLERIVSLVDGNSFVPGAKHIREGVVIKAADEHRVPGVGRAQLKIVSNRFLEKDSK